MNEGLVAQSCGGASVMSGTTIITQAILKQPSSNTPYAQCYAHQANFILKNTKNSHTTILCKLIGVLHTVCGLTKTGRHYKISRLKVEATVHHNLVKRAGIFNSGLVVASTKMRNH